MEIKAATLIVVAVESAVTTFMMAVVPQSRLEIMEWTLLPFLGTTLAAGGAFCFNTQEEVRKIVIGRCLFAITLGVVLTRLMAMVHPWVNDLMSDPLLKIGAGFAHGFGAYILSGPFTRKFYERANRNAAFLVQGIEKAMVMAGNKAPQAPEEPVTTILTPVHPSVRTDEAP